MKLSRQHKIFGGILGVAVLGLIADRALIQPNQAVADDLADEFAAPQGEENGESGFIAGASFKTESIAVRLNRLAEKTQANPLEVRDVFAPSWAADILDPVADSVVEPTTPEIPFDKRHRLTAVMGAGGGGSAIVDGKCLRIGQALDGMTLVSVGDRVATFESPHAKVTLTVEQTPGGAGSPAVSISVNPDAQTHANPAETADR